MHFINHLFLIYKAKSNKKQQQRQQQEENAVFSVKINAFYKSAYHIFLTKVLIPDQ